MNNKTGIYPGDSFFAGSNKGASAYVGIVINTENKSHGVIGHQDKCINVLVLGSFTEQSRGNVLSMPYDILQFPMYKELLARTVCAYTFSREIGLCKHHYNLQKSPAHVEITQYLQLKNCSALVYIDIAKHLLNGGDIDNYHYWEVFEEHQFFLIWSVLHKHFPNEVKAPLVKLDTSKVGYLNMGICTHGRKSIGQFPH